MMKYLNLLKKKIKGLNDFIEIFVVFFNLNQLLPIWRSANTQDITDCSP